MLHFSCIRCTTDNEWKEGSGGSDPAALPPTLTMEEGARQGGWQSLAEPPPNTILNFMQARCFDIANQSGFYIRLSLAGIFVEHGASHPFLSTNWSVARDARALHE